MSHTSGPWKATDSGNGILSGSTWVVHNFPKGEHGMVIDNPMDRFLIAAAPELLEALKLLLSAYEEAHNRFDLGDCDGSIKARAAIAKAEGTVKV